MNLSTFTDKVFANPAIHALIPKIVMEPDDRVRHDSEFATVITAETEDGQRYEAFVPLPARGENGFSLLVGEDARNIVLELLHEQILNV